MKKKKKNRGVKNRVIESVSKGGESAPRPLVPPRRVWIAVTSLAAAVALVRGGWLEPIVGAIIDQAVANIITLILCFSALMTILLWFLRESGYAATAKWAVLGGLLGAVVLGAAALRIERVSGDLIPEFAWRWSSSRDRLLPQHRAAAPDAVASRPTAPWQASPTDFPAFLGPTGTCGVDAPTLDPDWLARPPRRQCDGGGRRQCDCERARMRLAE